MEQVAYERPREKIQRRGAGSLGTVELWQVIIGSGTPGATGAQIARHVHKLIEQGSVAVDLPRLLSIAGLGYAKACQVLAVLELGRRSFEAHHDHSSRSQQKSSSPTETPRFDELRSRKHRAILAYEYDGAGVLLGQHLEPIKPDEHITLAVRRIFAHTLNTGAYSVVVGLGSRSQSVNGLSTDALSFVASLKDIATLLQIRVVSCWLVGRESQATLLQEKHG